MSRLYIPPHPWEPYRVWKSQKGGERDLLKLVKEAEQEYQWVYFTDVNQWYFPSQTPSGLEVIEEGNRTIVRMTSEGLGLAASFLHLEGEPIRYHIHPERYVNEVARIACALSDVTEDQARNFHSIAAIFPSHPDIEAALWLWDRSGHRHGKEFAIASPLGLSYLTLFASEAEPFQHIESWMRAHVSRDSHEGTIKTESALSETVRQFNEEFEGQLVLDFTPSSEYKPGFCRLRSLLR